MENESRLKVKKKDYNKGNAILIIDIGYLFDVIFITCLPKYTANITHVIIV